MLEPILTCILWYLSAVIKRSNAMLGSTELTSCKLVSIIIYNVKK